MEDIPSENKITEIGVLPYDWEVVTLDGVNIEEKKSINPSDFPEEIFEYYSIPAYKNFKKPFLEKGLNIKSQKIIVKNDAVLFGKLNPRVEKVWKITSNLKYRKIGSTEWIPIFPNEKKIISDYLYFLEHSNYVMPLAKKYVTGSTPSRQRVASNTFVNFKIPLPPLTEQKKISKILSSIQIVLKNTLEVIRSGIEFRRSAIEYLFTYGAIPIEKKLNIKLKKTDIGEIPENWQVLTIEEIADINSQNRNPKKTIHDKYFTYIDISGIEGELGRILKVKRLLGKNAPSRARRVIHTNNVLLSTVRPYLQAFTIVPEQFDDQICSTGFAVLDPKPTIKSEYLLYGTLSNKVGIQFRKKMRGSNYPALNVGDVKNTKFPNAPLEEQIRIIEILKAIDRKIFSEEKRKIILQKLFKLLLNKLSSGNLRVNNLEV